MLSISTISPATYNTVVLRDYIETHENYSLVTRTVNLDGSVSIVNLGTSVGKMTLAYQGKVNKTQEAGLKYMFDNQPFVLVCVASGCYLAAISKINIIEGFAKLTILLKNKENA
jgi:hypothetical protein